MQHLDAHRGKDAAELLDLRLDVVQRDGLMGPPVLVHIEAGNVLQGLGALLRRHHGAYHICLPALRQRLANGPIRDVAVGPLEHARGHARARDGAMADDARVQIAVHGQRERPRDGRRRHDQKVGPRAL